MQVETLRQLKPLYKSLADLVFGSKPKHFFNQQIAPHQCSVEELKIDPLHLQHYQKVCGITQTQSTPILYPHAMLGKLHLHIMSQPSFPLKLIGSVHKSNEVTQIRALKLDEIYHAKSWIDATRFAQKGIEFDLKTQILFQDEVIWAETSTYFKRQKNPIDDDFPTQYTFEKEFKKDLIAQWYLAPNLGMQYARVCHDYNPIHINRYLAKLFGFKRNIVHGFCLAAQMVDKTIENQTTVQLLFKGPSFLDHNVKLVGDKERNRYALFCAGNEKEVVSLNLLD